MKAVRIHEFGGPEVLKYEDAPDPILTSVLNSDHGEQRAR
jgi:NADPH:quinone reductase-like Zn-dependent oxidoreductase